MSQVLDRVRESTKSIEAADFLSTLFGGHRTEATGGARPVVLYGAGSAGKELHPLLKRHGVTPVCFCEGNPARVGEFYCDLPIISVEDLLKAHQDSLVVITVGRHSESIKERLVGEGLNESLIKTLAEQEAMAYYTQLAQWEWPELDLITHEEALEKAYNLLSDQRSRDLFVARIALFTRGSDFQSFRNFITKFSEFHDKTGPYFGDENTSIHTDCESYLQFNNDLITLEDNELFIDGGAFTGDSTLEFIKHMNKNHIKYNKIFCFEPDPSIFSKLQFNLLGYRDICFKPYGLWSHATRISFADSSLLQPGSTKIVSATEKLFLAASGTDYVEIETTSIDQEIHEGPVTLIKIDIEGAEIDALHGAFQTITRDKPRLIISVYHKRNDLFEILLLVHQMVPTYRFYLRHLSKRLGETTLFAIP